MRRDPAGEGVRRIRALTLWPEWAWAIHHLDKRVENRAWALPAGEWFALHAGKNIGGRAGPGAERRGVAVIREMGRRAGWTLIYDLWSFSFAVDPAARAFNLTAAAVERSAILGLFRITRTDPPGRGDLTGWRAPDQVGNVFEYVPLSAPIPCRGAQGLWTVPDGVAEALAPVVDRLTA